MARAILSLEGDPAQLRSVFSGLRQDSRATAEAVRGDFQKMGAAASTAYRQVARAAARNREKIVEEERKITEAARAGTEQRRQIVEAEGSYRQNAARAPVATAARTESAVTTAVARESRRRVDIYQREAEARRRAFQRTGRDAGGVVADAVIGASGQLVSEAGTVRRTVAQREQAINNALIQTVPQGANAQEIGRSNALIQSEIRRRNLDPDAAVTALNTAQSFANSLGGATPQARREAIMATMNDVEFASNIDPNNTTGIVKFGAMLRGRGVNERVRQEMLRSAVGISFTGSVETEEALRGGLGGMLSAVSTATANAPENQRDEITRQVVSDFLAQIQTVALSGGTARVTANRTTTLRNALSSPYTQNRLGEALAGREMSPEQQAEFGRVFTRGRDGQYSVNREMAGRPNEVAAMFGSLFNNDPSAIMSFLGAHGGGGNTQLLNRPEARLLADFMGMTQDSQGRSVRQYELERQIAATTLSPTQTAEIANVRAGELAAEERRRTAQREQNLGTETLWGRLSNATEGFAAEHPFASAMLGLGVPAAGRKVAQWAGGRAGGLLARGAGFARALNPLGIAASLLFDTTKQERGGYLDDRAAIAAHERAGGGTAGVLAGTRAQTTGASIDGRNGDGSVPVRLDPASATAVGQATAAALRSGGGIPVQTTPHSDAQGRARGASGSPPPAP